MSSPRIFDRVDDEPAAATDEGFQEFIQRRRNEAAHRKQLRVLVALVACLTVACVALAVSNVMLARRVAAVRVLTPPVEPPTVAEPAGLPPRDVELPRPDVAEREIGASAPAAQLPAELRRPPAARRVAVTPPAGPRPLDPVRRTAEWMVEHYGRGEAETRAAATAAFYATDDPNGAYWRSVLARIQRGR